MKLLETLQHLNERHESYFRQHLIREDIARISRMLEPGFPGNSAEEFLAAGSKLEWTPDDRRTHELKATLVPFLEAVHAWRQAATAAAREDIEPALSTTWAALEKDRIDRLVGCLSRVPRP